MRTFLILLVATASIHAQGSLVIVGGGSLPLPIRERFVALAGGKDARIVVIPTASENADKPAEHASYLKGWNALTPNVVLLHTRDRAVADTPEFIRPLQTATGVWFSGGDQSRVTTAYLGTKTETAFRDVLKRGGVLGGTSAGAALMSHPMITGGTTTATSAAGFGFLPGFITDQHFLKRNRQPRLKGLLETHPGLVGLGIDEATAAVITGDTLEVLGDSTATLYLSPGQGYGWFEHALKPGDKLDVPAMTCAARLRAP